MSRAIASLSLYDWLELAALLAASSGLLLLLSAAIARLTVVRSAQRPTDDGGMLLANISRFGIMHLAIGGALFALAETVELVN